MADAEAFTQIDPDLGTVLDTLRKFEPIFHRAAFGATLDDFARRMAPEYWEVGASGQRYTREFILRHLEQSPPVDGEATGWVCSEFGLGSLGPDTYLLTYTLDQTGRITRRTTIWRRTAEGWRILYHQGTIVSATDET